LTKSPFRIAALVLLSALLATNFYRAATQSIVHDEALSWQFYLSGPVSAIFQTYTANNHFLATILFRLSITLFGDSEFAMRLPTVLAGAWFFWTVFRLCGLIFGDGWLFLLACAALTLNPILLDFLVAARGYGLAIAGLFWALYQMLVWLHDRDHKRLWKAALGCAIAVAANLTLLMPVFLVATAFCVLLLQKSETGGAPGLQLPTKARQKSKKAKPEAARVPARSYSSFLHFVVPVVLLAIVFVIVSPIELARGEDLYTGTAAAMESLRSLVHVSFAYGNGSGIMPRVERIWSGIALVFLPLVTLAAMVISVIATRLARSPLAVATLFSSLAVVGSAILLAAAHLLSGIPYPEDRTGIYFVPLATLAALGFARILFERPGFPRCIGVAVALVLASFTIEFAAQWNVSSFWVWRYDADTKRIFEALEVAPKPPGQVRLGVSWVFEPALNYYREVRKAAWMAPVLRDGFDGARQFYVVSAPDRDTAALPHLKPIYQGTVSGAELAIPQ
jgi:Dolichyl-phosphate-mannose-protein mannosyltransferase